MADEAVKVSHNLNFKGSNNKGGQMQKRSLTNYCKDGAVKAAKAKGTLSQVGSPKGEGRKGSKRPMSSAGGYSPSDRSVFSGRSSVCSVDARRTLDRFNINTNNKSGPESVALNDKITQALGNDVEEIDKAKKRQ